MTEITKLLDALAGANMLGVFEVPDNATGIRVSLSTQTLDEPDNAVVVTDFSNDGGSTWEYFNTFTAWAEPGIDVAVSERGWPGHADQDGKRVADIPTHVRVSVLSPKQTQLDIKVEWAK